MSSKLPNFIETRPFSESWDDLNLRDEDLQSLQQAILRDPTKAPVIPGTGGLRKLRFVPRRWSKGKRGALRVCFVYFQEDGVVLLALCYSKTEKDDLSPDDKKAIRQLIQRQEQAFRGSPG